MPIEFGNTAPSANSTSPLNEKEDDTITGFKSFFAGIGSGLFKIPEGVFSLGAALYDLGADTNTAAQVESFFDKINPFDEMAEKTTAGKITEFVVSLGIPSTAGYKLGTSLAKKAIDAKKKPGNYLSSNKVTSLIKEKKNLGKNSLIKDEVKDRAKIFAGGLGGAGITDFIFTNDDFGTLGDELGGITKRDVREGLEGREDAVRRLSNRLKFATEGAAIGSILGGGFALLKEGAKANKIIFNNDPVIQAVRKAINSITPEGSLPKEIFNIQQTGKSLLKGFEKGAADAGEKIQKAMDDILDASANLSLSTRKKKLFSNLISDTLSQKGRTKEVTDLQRFNRLDNFLQNELKLAKGSEQVVNLKETILEARGAVDSLSENLLKIIPDTSANQALRKKIQENLGSYLNRSYQAFERDLPTLAGFEKYFPARDAIRNARRYIIKNFFNDPVKTTKEKRDLIFKTDEVLTKLLKGEAQDLPPFIDAKALQKLGLNRDIDTGILKPRKNVPEELRAFYGEVKDPAVQVAQTLAKQTSSFGQVKMLDEIAVAGDKKIFFDSAEEAAEAFNIPKDKVKELLVQFKQGENLNNLVPTKLNQKYTLKTIGDSIIDQVDNQRNGTISKLYNYFVLAPKSISQQAKTIFSPFTHLRNFVSASAFTMMNGNWFTNPAKAADLFKKSWNAFSKGKNSPEARKKYLEYLQEGVVTTNPVLGEIENLAKDVMKMGSNEPNNLIGRLMKPFSKIREFAIDKYAAEDSYWKIWNYEAEKDAYTKVFDNFFSNSKFFAGKSKTAISSAIRQARTKGINSLPTDERKAVNSLTKMVGDVVGRPVTIDDGLFNTVKFGTKGIEEVDPIEGIVRAVSSDVTKNNIPNYEYVGDFVKGLRRLPLGTFIAFPAEILRTGFNTIQRGIREVKNPYTKGLGMKRLAGVATTGIALPAGAVELGKQLSGFTDEQMQALKKFVPSWSENGLLVPTGIDSESGRPQYLDLSYIYPYDSLIRPVTTALNEISKGTETEEKIFKTLTDSAIVSMSELAKPFVSEAIFIEAVTDVFVRGGRTRENTQVFREGDPIGEKVYKAGMHVVETFAPGSLKSIQRISSAPFNIADKYGQTYDLGDEVAGIFGFRNIELDPAKSLKFMVSDFNKGLSSARGSFLGDTLRGGKVSPQEVFNQYLGSEMMRQKYFQQMSQNVQAARVLGVSENVIMKELQRIPKKDRGALLNNTYSPYVPSKNVLQTFFKNAQKLATETGEPIYNPMDDAITSIIEYVNQNLGKELDNDLDFDVSQPTDSRVGSILEGLDFLTRPTTNTGPGTIVTGQGQGSTNANVDVRFRQGTITDPTNRTIAGLD